ncbi:hypothetical protein A4S06_06940 [Erysipelotrichaceae bacterium MTC7]|nr:hypothetical protein A4S06_06940 [Erysipelotrichaceae bacterium MTC7]
MNTMLFTYALEVAESGSITHAAENLYMAQPNLSKAIKELEDQLGYQIFERSSKGMFPTKEGAEFLTYAKSVLSQIEKIKSLSAKKRTNVELFDVSIPRGSYIAQAFTDFVSTINVERGIDFNMQETNSVKTITTVADGTFHLGIIRYQVFHEKYFTDYIKNRKLDMESLWKFKLYLTFSKDHPLANEERIKQKMLTPYLEIVHGDNIVPYLNAEYMNDSGQESQRKRIYVYERYNQFDLLETITNSYMWASPIPTKILEKHNLVQRSCVGVELVYRDAIIYPQGYQLSPLDKRFIDCVMEEQKRVAQIKFR